jgi:hypothetical protein
MKLVLYIGGEKTDSVSLPVYHRLWYMDRRNLVINEGNKLLLRHQKRIILNKYVWEMWVVIDGINLP